MNNVCFSLSDKPYSNARNSVLDYISYDVYSEVLSSEMTHIWDNIGRDISNIIFSQVKEEIDEKR